MAAHVRLQAQRVQHNSARVCACLRVPARVCARVRLHAAAHVSRPVHCRCSMHMYITVTVRTQKVLLLASEQLSWSIPFPPSRPCEYLGCWQDADVHHVFQPRGGNLPSPLSLRNGVGATLAVFRREKREEGKRVRQFNFSFRGDRGPGGSQRHIYGATHLPRVPFETSHLRLWGCTCSSAECDSSQTDGKYHF